MNAKLVFMKNFTHWISGLVRYILPFTITPRIEDNLSLKSSGMETVNRVTDGSLTYAVAIQFCRH